MVRWGAFSEGGLWGTRVGEDNTSPLVPEFPDFDRLRRVLTAADAEPSIRLAYHTPTALVAGDAPERRYPLS